MRTSRLEAFSDGVFAIAMTLLVLEIRVNPTGDESLADALLDDWPSYLAYATSFLTIAVMWVNHHAVFDLVARADRAILFLNSLLLMLVAFVPFPTRLIAENLRLGEEKTAAVFYGLTLLLVGAMFQAVWRYVATGRRLIRPEVDQEEVDDITRSFNPGIPVYGLATAVAFLSPTTSIVIYLALAVFYALPAQLYRRRRR